MTRLVLIRHGEAVCNVEGIIGGPRGCTGLSPLGAEQARQLRDRLLRTGELAEVSVLISSTLPRAKETASIIAPAIGGGRVAPVEDCEVCELHPGPEIDGLTWDEYASRYPPERFPRVPDREVAPGGESWAGFVARVAAAMDRIVEEYSSQSVVIACHGGVVVASMIKFLGLPRPEERAGLDATHTSLTEFVRDDGTGRWRLERYNDFSHLLG